MNARYARVRTILIGHGVIAAGWLTPQPGHADNLLGSPHTLMLCGIALQIVLAIVHALLRRYVADDDVSSRSSSVVELIGDGVTVLLFALGTLGTILGAASSM